MRRGNDSINIREVARVAKVGVATVSRVINDSDLISPKTSEHVRAIIRQLGYRPHALARRIMRRSQLICFVLVNRPFLHAFHAAVLQGAETCARGLKQHVVFIGIECAKETPPDQIVLPPILEEKGWAEGVILTGAVFPNLLSRIEELGLPVVAFGNSVSCSKSSGRFNQVRYDGFRAELEATEYLMSYGHRRIAFVGDIVYPWFFEQHQGYLKAMRLQKFAPLSFTSTGPQDDVEYGRFAADQLMKRKCAFSAVLAGNDGIAAGLCLSLRQMGVKVPDDVSVVGFDDREIASLMNPPLTTVRLPAEDIGSSCVKLLLENLHNGGQGAITRVVPTELVKRGSVRSQVTFKSKPGSPRNDIYSARARTGGS